MAKERPRAQSGLTAAVGGAVRPFGKYFLVRKLAEGGMAEIFLAKQLGAEGFERNVVIKRMLSHLSAAPDFVNMFLDEARLAARLAHPNIIQINDLGLTDGCYFICMEYLAGEDFSTILRTAGRRREYVPLHVVVRVAAEAAHGLHFAHEFTDEQGRPLNVVHRDISPSNIYVTYQGQVKLLDFGIAKAESRATQTTAGVVKGKYMYMSPEQARSGEVDRRADVFSLGVSLYEAVTNVRPFARDNDLAILNAVLTCSFQPPRSLRPDLPQELEAIILKAMSVEPGERYQTAGQMAADLERFYASTTSGSSGTGVATYLRTFFGEERYASKTRIPTLASLAASGVDVPGFTNPVAPKTDPAFTQVATEVSRQREAETRVAGQSSPAVAVVRPGRSRGLATFGILAGFAALGAAGYLAYRAYGVERPGPGGEGVADAPDAGEVAAQTPDAGLIDAGLAVAEEPPDAGALSTKPPHSRPPRPVQLTAQDIQRVVMRNSINISKCFELHRDELKASAGKANVTFTIVSSGRVTQASCELGGKVGACLESRVRSLKFPAHRDREVTLTLPFGYQVQR